MDESSLNVIRIMQSAIAPVTLISGIGFLILTMANRFGRTLDRGRVIMEKLEMSDPGTRVHALLEEQIKTLFWRARLLRTTMALSGAAIFFVTTTVGVLFAQLSTGYDLHNWAQVTFVIGLLLLIVSVMLFVREISTALRVFKLEIRTNEISRSERQAQRKSPGTT